MFVCVYKYTLYLPKIKQIITTTTKKINHICLLKLLEN